MRRVSGGIIFRPEFGFSLLQIIVSVVDLLIGGDPNAVMVIVRFVERAGSFVHFYQPLGVGMFHDCAAVSLRHNLQRQQFLEDR